MKGILNKALSLALLISVVPVFSMDRVKSATQAGFDATVEAAKAGSKRIAQGFNDYVMPMAGRAAQSVQAHPYIAGAFVAVPAFAYGSYKLYANRQANIKNAMVAVDAKVAQAMVQLDQVRAGRALLNGMLTSMSEVKDSKELMIALVGNYNALASLNAEVFNNSLISLGSSVEEFRNTKAQSADKLIAAITSLIKEADVVISAARNVIAAQQLQVAKPVARPVAAPKAVVVKAPVVASAKAVAPKAVAPKAPVVASAKAVVAKSAKTAEVKPGFFVRNARAITLYSAALAGLAGMTYAGLKYTGLVK